MDDYLRAEAEDLTATLEDRSEAALLLALLEIASLTPMVEQSDDDYTPFVYPH